MKHALSVRLLRLYLRTYPREFRERFGADLESDFLQLLSARGARAAWKYALSDLRRAVPMTHTDDQRARQRRYAVTLGGDSHMATLSFDLRHSLRALLKSPVFTAVTVATLALGIGATTAIFTLVNAVLLRPLGYHDPDRLVMLHEIIPNSGVPRFGVSPADYLDVDQHQAAFTDIGAYRTRAMELSGTGNPESVTVAETTAAVFPVLGVNAVDGRTFLATEDQSEPAVAVISDALRRRRFAASSPIGERIVLDRRPYTIVGVMPAGFEFPKRGPQFNGTPADIYLPLVFNPFERRARGMFYNHSVIGRLRDGVTIEQAARDTAALAPRVVENYPAELRGIALQIATTRFIDEVVGEVRRPLLILLGAVALVLLVACANVANLFLSRAVARQRELGVRVALGASRYRLFQMLLVESLLLALLSGAAGLVIANWTLRAVPAVLTASLPGLSEVTLDARVLAFTLTLSFMTAVFFGVVPLAAGMRREVTDALREGARASGGRRQHRLQAGLIVTSVAFAFVLLVASGLLIRSFTNLMQADSGVNALNVLNLEVSLPFAGYNQAPRIRSFYQTLHERLLAIPGVKSAVVTTDLPLRADGERRAWAPENGADQRDGIPSSIALTWAHGDYFATFGVPLIRGRNFTAEEQFENRRAVIVSKNIADRYWPGQDPIGKRLKWGLNAASPAPWLTVVGVAGDVVDGPLGSDPVIHAYAPYSEMNDQGLASPLAGLWRRLNVAVNGDVDAAALTPSVRAAIAALDPALAVAKVTTMREVVRELSAPQRFSAAVLTAFAAGALLLASIGLYGVLAFAVAQRTREIGVRLALGAPRGTVLKLILKQGMLLVAIGLVIGLAGALGAARLLGSLLYETDIYDPATFVMVPVLLAMVSLAACYLPARRAAVLDPLVTLRSE
jgi:putative ABC transport system permease protein